MITLFLVCFFLFYLFRGGYAGASAKCYIVWRQSYRCSILSNKGFQLQVFAKCYSGRGFSKNALFLLQVFNSSNLVSNCSEQNRLYEFQDNKCVLYKFTKVFFNQSKFSIVIICFLYCFVQCFDSKPLGNR